MSSISKVLKIKKARFNNNNMRIATCAEKKNGWHVYSWGNMRGVSESFIRIHQHFLHHGK